MRYAGWLARRFHDPAFSAGWPHFGTDDYWQRETDDLEEQLEEIRRALDGAPELAALSGSVSPVTSEEELLSNKDYFWDWEGD